MLKKKIKKNFLSHNGFGELMNKFLCIKIVRKIIVKPCKDSETGDYTNNVESPWQKLKKKNEKWYCRFPFDSICKTAKDSRTLFR